MKDCDKSKVVFDCFGKKREAIPLEVRNEIEEHVNDCLPCWDLKHEILYWESQSRLVPLPGF
jgi:hypothetical protein